MYSRHDPGQGGVFEGRCYNTFVEVKSKVGEASERDYSELRTWSKPVKPRCCAVHSGQDYSGPHQDHQWSLVSPPPGPSVEGDRSRSLLANELELVVIFSL